MWDGILQSCYLDERGNLLDRFDGIIYKWMYVRHNTLPTDAASSPVIVSRNGRTFRFTPKIVEHGIVIADESLVPCPMTYTVDGCHRFPASA